MSAMFYKKTIKRNSYFTIINIINVSDWTKCIRSKYGMEECNVMKIWDENCKNDYESVRLCEQIREMWSWMGRCDMTLFNKEECSTIIVFLCTG